MAVAHRGQMRVVCRQHRDDIPDADELVIPPLVGESPVDTLERKFRGAVSHGWEVERTGPDSFHAWKLYADGDGTPDRPNRKDRYFTAEV